MLCVVRFDLKNLNCFLTNYFSLIILMSCSCGPGVKCRSKSCECVVHKRQCSEHCKFSIKFCSRRIAAESVLLSPVKPPENASDKRQRKPKRVYTPSTPEEPNAQPPQRVQSVTKKQKVQVYQPHKTKVRGIQFVGFRKPPRPFSNSAM
jgi:hypothetical protein